MTQQNLEQRTEELAQHLQRVSEQKIDRVHLQMWGYQRSESMTNVLFKRIADYMVMWELNDSEAYLTIADTTQKGYGE